MRKTDRQKHLPNWARVLRQESERFPDKAAAERRDVEYNTQRDKDARWSPSVSLKRVEEDFKFPLTQHINQSIASGNFSEKNPFTVLELGCFDGRTLQDLKKSFRGKIKTVGHTLAKTPGFFYRGVDRLIEGEIGRLNPKERFNLIISPRLSGVSRTHLKETAVAKVIELLKPQGLAILTMGDLSEIDMQRIGTILLQNGIRDYAFYGVPKNLRFSKPLPNLP